MPDSRETAQLKMRIREERRETGGKSETRLPQAPRQRERGNSGPLGHLVEVTQAGEKVTVSGKPGRRWGA